MSKPVKTIQSVQRAVDILNCFTVERPNLSIHELSQSTDLNINTARGLINTLVVNKLLIYNKASGLYSLGNFFYAKSAIMKETFYNYIQMFKYLVDNIANKYHLTSSLQLVHQDEILTIYCAYPQNTAYYITLLENSPLPVHATSSGKLLLAYAYTDDEIDSISYTCFTESTKCDKSSIREMIKKIRQQGYGSETEEFAPGVASIAVPIFDHNKELVATVSTTLFAKVLPKIKKELLSDLQTIAQKIMNELH